MDEYGWASAVGRIRIKEKELLSRADLMRVAEAPDLERALAALRDSAYGPYVSAAKEPSMFEAALSDALSGAYEYVLAISPEPMVIAAYRGRNDFHNLKVRAKSACFGMPLEREAFSHMGNFDTDFDPGQDIRAAGDKVGLLGPADSASLAKGLAETYRGALSLVAAEKGNLPEGVLALKVDTFVDRCYYAWFSRVFRRFGYQGLSGFQRSEVDLLNLRMSVRAIRIGLSAAIYADVALPGGDISYKDLVLAYEAGPEGIRGVFRDSPWSALAVSGAAISQEKKSLTKWEKDCDEALMLVARKARYYSLGPEPVFGYLFGKEVEVRNLRVILSGKQSLLPSQEIAERLREPYV